MSIFVEKLQLRIDGKDYHESHIFSNIRLNQELLKPNELRFNISKNTLVEDENDLKINFSSKLLGKEVDFLLTTYRDDDRKSIFHDELRFKGLIFNVKALRSHMGGEMEYEVTAYSHDYLLWDNANCFSYENMDLKGIVSDVFSKCGDLPAATNPVMSDSIPYSVQYNETAYEFLRRLAERYGEWFYNDGTQTVFGKLQQRDAVDLLPGYDVVNYQYQMNMHSLKFAHARHNYLDYQNTQAQASSATSSALHRLTDYAYNASEKVYQKESLRNYHSSVAEENGLDEVEYSTKAEGLGRKTGMMTCQVTSNRADLTIGSLVRFKEFYDPGTGQEQSFTHDQLLICGITHYAHSNGNYENEFVAVPASVEYPPYAFGDRYPQAEAQRAVVKDNKDPEKLGRVRVQFLWQQEQDDSLMTPWIRIAQPHGGGNKGFYFIPEMEEEVMVGFENGNAEKPYVTGTLYHGQAKPPESWYNDDDNIKAIRTRSGHTIEFHDTEGEELIKIYDNEKDNFILTFSTHEQLIKLESKGNIELYAQKDIIIDARENISITAGKNISETAEEENITVSAAKNIDESAGENNTIKVGKDRTIEVVNNISEKAGDDNTIDIGKNRNITVGNNISEKAGDNVTIDVGKDRSINVGSNISESAGSNVKIDAGSNMEASAGSNMGLSASDNIGASAGKNLSISAEDNITESAGKNLIISADKDGMISISQNMNLSVGKDMQADIDKNLYASVSSKFDLKAKEIEQASTGKTRIIAANSELKADSSMKISGGGSMDIKAGNVKIN
mgnify:CR=1 FL=1